MMRPRDLNSGFLSKIAALALIGILLTLSSPASADDWLGTGMRFKDAATKKRYLDAAAQCKGDASKYETLIVGEATTAGQATAAAIGGLPELFWGPAMLTCKKNGDKRNSELTTVECLGKRIDSLEKNIKAGVVAINRDGIRPDQAGFPGLDTGILKVIRKACDLAESPKDQMSNDEVMCVADALESLRVRFSNTRARLKDAYQHLALGGLVSGSCLADKTISAPLSCNPPAAEQAYSTAVAQSRAASEKVDLVTVARATGAHGGSGGDPHAAPGGAGSLAAGGDSPGGSPLGSPSGSPQGALDGKAGSHGTSDHGAVGTGQVQSAGTCVGDACKNNGDNTPSGCKDGHCDGNKAPTYVDVNDCRKQLAAATAAGGAGYAAGCKPSETLQLQEDVTRLTTAIKTQQGSWDPKTQREVDMAEDLLRSRALNYIQVLSESNLGSCGFATALNNIPKACGEPNVGGHVALGFSSPIASVVEAARSKYLKGGDHCDKRDEPVAQWQKGRDNEELNAQRTQREVGALAAARELSQLDGKFTDFAADFAENEEEFFKSWPSFLPCRTILNLVGYSWNTHKAVCKGYGKMTAAGGFEARRSGITIGELLEADDLNSPDLIWFSRPDNERGKAIVVEIKDLRQKLKNLAQADPANFEKNEGPLVKLLRGKEGELSAIRSRYWTKADQLLIAGFNVPTQIAPGIVIDQPVREASMQNDDLYNRCEKKSRALSKIISRMAALKTQFPELNATVNGVPAYRQIGPLVGTAQEGLARIHYNEGSKDYWNGDPTKSFTQQISLLCKDPVGVVDSLLLKNDNLFNQVYACSTELAAVEPDFLQVEKERAASCRARRDQAGNPCIELENIRNAQNGVMAKAGAFVENGMQAFDAVACLSVVYGAGAAIAKTAVVIGAEGVGAGVSLLARGAAQTGVSTLKHTFTTPGGLAMFGLFTGMGAKQAYDTSESSEAAPVLAREGLMTPDEAAALRHATLDGLGVWGNLIKDSILGVAAGGMVGELGRGMGEVLGKDARTVAIVKSPEMDRLFSEATNADKSGTPLSVESAQDRFKEQMIEQMKKYWGTDPDVIAGLQKLDFKELKKLYENGKFVAPEHPELLAAAAQKRRDNLKAVAEITEPAAQGARSEAPTVTAYIEGVQEILKDPNLSAADRQRIQTNLAKVVAVFGSPEQIEHAKGVLSDFVRDHPDDLAGQPQLKAAIAAFIASTKGSAEEQIEASRKLAIAYDQATSGPNGARNAGHLAPVAEFLNDEIKRSDANATPEQLAGLSPKARAQKALTAIAQLGRKAKALLGRVFKREDGKRQPAEVADAAVGEDAAASDRKVGELDPKFNEEPTKLAASELPRDAQGNVMSVDEVLAKRRALREKDPVNLAKIIERLMKNCKNSAKGDDVKIRNFLDKIAVSESCPAREEVRRLALAAGLRLLCSR